MWSRQVEWPGAHHLISLRGPFSGFWGDEGQSGASREGGENGGRTLLFQQGAVSQPWLRQRAIWGDNLKGGQSRAMVKGDTVHRERISGVFVWKSRSLSRGEILRAVESFETPKNQSTCFPRPVLQSTLIQRASQSPHLDNNPTFYDIYLREVPWSTNHLPRKTHYSLL